MSGRMIRTLAWTLALLVGFPAQAQFKHITPETDAVDSAMLTYARIDWDDPLNPRYVNLGNDQLLLDTQRGVQLWDVPTNILSRPRFVASLGNVELRALQYGTQTWARLGDAPAGTALVASGHGNTPHILLWWDGQGRQFAAALPLDGRSHAPSLLALGPRHLLLCARAAGGRVVRLTQTGGAARLAWEDDGAEEAREALRRTGVVGTVAGFGTLTEADTNRPVLYDVSQCGWEIRQPPEHLAAFLDKKTRRQDPHIKPYFLGDGRILVSEVSYFNGQHWQDMNPPLLWQPEARRWLAIEPTSGRGSQVHRVGLDEPVMAHGFQSELIEFLDTRTMQWRRSRQRLPYGYGADIEPLSNGNALVLMRESRTASSGMAGIVAPLRAAMPPGGLAIERHRYDGEIVLRGGSLLLVGDGHVWEPSVRSEIIDAARGQAHQIASLPTPQVSPYGMELKDGSVLILGGLAPRCGPEFYFFAAEPCSRLPAQISYRFFPEQNRWQALPELRIPFTRGYWWETGNSGLASRWPRNDARVRDNGDAVWIEGGEFFGASEEELLPKTSLLRRWRPTATASPAVEPVARLRKARRQASLIELVDGRLAVIGGWTQLERVALEKECIDCPDDFVSLGPFRPARTTEVLDESGADRPVWQPGPPAHHAGGRALRLANGRIFKLSLAGDFDSDGYRAEIADAAFTRWQKLPPFPVTPAIVRNVSVAGNRILILTNTAKTVIWDDEAARWDVRTAWPRGVGSERDAPLSITGLANDERMLVRYPSTFEVVPLPKH